MTRSSFVAAISALAIVIGAASWSQPDLVNADLWWHLASGRQIAESGEIPKVDSFSHTAAGEPWINHGWLWDRLAWSAYRVHPDVLAGLNLALIAAMFWLVSLSARRATGSWVAAGAATWLAAGTCHWFLDIRPQMVTLFLTALLLATLGGRRAPWTWPPLFLVWSNLHAGFAFGLGLVGLHLLITTVRALAGRDRSALPVSGWIGLGLAALAVGINPWSFEIYAVPFQPLDPQTPFQDLIEWLPPALGLDPRSYGGRFVWMALAAFAGAVRFRRAPLSVALAAVTLVMALSARRFIPLFAIVAAPAAAVGLAPCWELLRQRAPVLSQPGARTATGLVGLAIALALWHDVRLFPDLLRRWTSAESMPSGAAAYLEALPRPPRRLFHDYAWGGFLALHAPSVPIFIDGRAGTVYRDDLARDYFALAGARDGWRTLLDSYRIDAVLIPVGSRLARALQRAPHPWRMVHADPRAALLLAPGFDGATPRPSEVLPDSADVKLFQGYLARMNGENGLAAAAHTDALARDPLLLDAYGELMLIAALEDRPEAVEAWTDAALRALPRRWNQIWSNVEYAWQQAGDPTRRLDAIRRVRLDGPFTPAWLHEAAAERLRLARQAARNGVPEPPAGKRAERPGR